MEDRWDGSPFLRMLSSPLRRCAVTANVLPKDLMLQLKPVRLPAPPDGPSRYIEGGKKKINSPPQVILPDQLLHPRFAQKKLGKGMWVTLHKTILEEVERRGAYKQLAPHARFPSRLAEFITLQLQQRVLQEAEMMQNRLTTRARRIVIESLTQPHGAGRTVDKRATEAKIVDLLGTADGDGRPIYSAGLICEPTPGDATEFHRPVPVSQSTKHSHRERDSAPTVPLYDLSMLAADQLQRLRQDLDAIHSYETHCLDHGAPGQVDPLKRPADEGRTDSGGSYALRQSAHTVDLAVALWRLMIWNSA